MSYDIQLFKTETKQREQKSNDQNFFENEKNLEPFTSEQFRGLKDRLLKYDYVLELENTAGLHFIHPEYGINALLTDRGLYLSASWKEESIFEAGMMASEFTDSGEFEKYDPQNNGWEEL